MKHGVLGSIASSRSKVPNAPSSLTATAVSYDQINLSWQDNSDNETGFKIDRSPSGLVETYSQIDTVGANVTTYQNTGLSASTTYYYMVKAYNDEGDSALSNAANDTTDPLPDPPATPTGLSVEENIDQSVTATWNSSSGATGYNVRYNIDGGLWTLPIDTGSSRNWTSGVFGVAEIIYVEVRAYNAGGDSAWSLSVFVTIGGGGGS